MCAVNNNRSVYGYFLLVLRQRSHRTVSRETKTPPSIVIVRRVCLCVSAYTCARGFQRDSASYYTRFPVRNIWNIALPPYSSTASACAPRYSFVPCVWRWRTLETCTDLREPASRDNRVLKSHSNTVGRSPSFHCTVGVVRLMSVVRCALLRVQYG